MPTLTFKVTIDEARRIRTEARGKRMTLSEYVRRRALNGGRTPRRVRRLRCEHTGVMIFSSPAGARPLTTETVRDMLADFP
jgi:hypothetical protein